MDKDIIVTIKNQVKFYFRSDKVASRFLADISQIEGLTDNQFVENILFVKYILQGGYKITKIIDDNNEVDVTEDVKKAVELLTTSPAIRKEYI